MTHFLFVVFKLPNEHTVSVGYFTDVAKPNPQTLGFARAALKVLTLQTSPRLFPILLFQTKLKNGGF